MGKHTNDWILEEKDEDIQTCWGVSLKQEKNKYPLLSLQFGDEKLQIPQNSFVFMTVTEGNCCSIEEGIYDAVYEEAAERRGIPVNYKTKNNETTIREINRGIGELIYEKGPHYVLGKAMSKGHHHEMGVYSGSGLDQELSVALHHENFDHESYQKMLDDVALRMLGPDYLEFLNSERKMDKFNG